MQNTEKKGLKGILKELLLLIVNNLDSGNSNIDEEDELAIIETLKHFTDKEVRYSKYMAFTYLGVSRATFDNLIKEGKLPKGAKISGFKELSWSLKDLEAYKHSKN